MLYSLTFSIYCSYQPAWIRFAIIGERNRSDPNDGQIHVKIQNYTLHPRWKPSQFPAYDFAIITLDRKQTFSQHIKKATLPSLKNFEKSKM